MERQSSKQAEGENEDKKNHHRTSREVWKTKGTEALSHPIVHHSLLKGEYYDNPWPEWHMKKQHPLPSREELDTHLPVLSPDEEVLSTFHQTDRARQGAIQATWIGHATFLVQMAGVTFLTDPVWGERCSPLAPVGVGPARFRPPPLPIDHLPRIDFVLISHNHYDHLCSETVAALRKRSSDTVWFVPKGLGKWFRSMSCHNTVEMAWWEETLFQRSPSPSSSPPSPPSTRSPNHISTVRIAFTPAQHWSLRSGFDRFETLWGSWCVLPLQSTPPSPASSSPPSSSPVARLFFSGDTGYCGTYKEIGEIHGPFDLALIPVGAYCPRWMMQPQHVDPMEAVKMHVDIKSRHSIGMHWGTFVLTNEQVYEPRSKLREEVAEAGLKEGEFHCIAHGETIVVDGYVEMDITERNGELTAAITDEKRAKKGKKEEGRKKKMAARKMKEEMENAESDTTVEKEATENPEGREEREDEAEETGVR